MDKNFATHYFQRFKSLPPFFRDQPDEGLGVVVIIPCIDDAFVFHTLDSLERANAIHAAIEVIVNVNSGEMTPPDIIGRNRMIFEGLKRREESEFYKKFRLLPMLVEGTTKKKAGVGFARKTAMDEAVRRFAAIDKPDGLIVSLDADTLVAENYFREIMHAYETSKAACFTFQFRHNYDAEQYPQDVMEACRLYEIYLRYYRLSLKTFKFPFSIHTIGSCFAVHADAYTRLGGMTSRQGGEDFYFLQKAVKMHPVHEVMNPIVFPSPRVSNRVPFGTGPSVRRILEKGGYTVYNFELFRLLGIFYELFPAMEHEDVKDKIPMDIITYIGDKPFCEILSECRNYSGSSGTFLKRMYDKFDAFFIVKFLNMFNNSCTYPPVEVVEAGRDLLKYYGITETDNLYETITMLDLNVY
ncbi:MAG: glycosyltransferase family 2 protein [Tannerella sp.]|nr:glycosyltransferase family 2 protein [Tannerella sp.]